MLFLCTISMMSCDDDDDKFTFTGAALKQTQWTGTYFRSYIAAGQPATGTYDIGIIFYTDSTGLSSIDRDEYGFNYSIDDKMLLVTNGDSYLNGYWLLRQADENSMSLEQGTGGENAFKATLTLTRKK